MKHFRMSDIATYVLKVVVCGIVGFIGMALAGALGEAAGIKLPPSPAGSDPKTMAIVGLLTSPLLALGLAPLAVRLTGGFVTRWLALALLGAITLGLNTALEVSIFTTMLAHGGFTGMVLLNTAAMVAVSAAVARLFRQNELQRPRLPNLPTISWTWRVAAAIAAFPCIYFLFGALIGPLVVDRYRNGIQGLVLPGIGVILSMQVLRSTLFLLASIPVLVLCTGSVRSMIVRLGWAFAVLVGLYGLASAFWLPTILRVAHGAEITADSFAYAAVLVLLLRAAVPSRAPAVAAAVSAH